MHLTAGCHLPQKGKKKKSEMTDESKTLYSAGKYWENIIIVNSSGHNNREKKIRYGDSSVRYDSRFLGCKCDYVINRLCYEMSNNVEKTAQNPKSFHLLL